MKSIAKKSGIIGTIIAVISIILVGFYLYATK